MRENVENKNPVNIRFVAKTSDLMLKHQQWQHWLA